MKKYNNSFFPSFLLSFLFIASIMNAQENVSTVSDGAVDPSIYKFDADLEKYYQDMQMYILDKMAEPMPDELKHQINHAEEHANRVLSKQELVHLIRQHWKFDFISQNMQPIKSSENLKNLNSICVNGGFEDDFNGYSRFRGIFNSSNLDCIPTVGFVNPDTIMWELLTDIPSLYPHDYPYEIDIVDPGIDPYLGNYINLQKVQFDNKAIRLNDIVSSASTGCGRGNNGINKIEKKFTVDQSSQEIVVWYAVILNDPIGGHMANNSNRKPFFSIEFLHNDIVVDNLCWISDEDFFEEVSGSNVNCPNNNFTPLDVVRYQNWRCSIFDLSNFNNEEITLRITTADCGDGAHFGYAYVDGICEACAEVNLISLDRCAVSTYEFCGSYNIVEGTTSNLDLVSMSYILLDENNNRDTIQIPFSNIDTTNKTFCIDVDPIYIQPDLCYDIYAVGYFSSGGGLPVEIRSSTWNPGQFNDFCDFEEFDYSIAVTCDNNNTSFDIGDDQFSLNVDLTIQDNGTWVIYQSNGIDIASGMGDQIVNLGPFNYQDCDYFTLYDPVCDTTILLDYDVQCSGCTNLFRLCTHEIICDDRGTTNTSDDQWSIVLYVENNNNGSYSIDPPFTIGTYNTPITYNMGEISQYGATHTIRITDSVSGCFLDYTLDVPQGCNGQCTYGYNHTISDCKIDKHGGSYYNVTFESIGGFNTCLPDFYLVNSNGSTSLLNKSVSGNFIELGPFSVSQGAITIRIVGCNSCEEEIVIYPPNCSIGSKRLIDEPLTEFISHEGLQMVVTHSDILLLWDDIGATKSVRIYNMNGQLVFNQKNMHSNSIIDHLYLSSGIYFVQLLNNDGSLIISKFFKQ